jgi:hypothetical protein
MSVDAPAPVDGLAEGDVVDDEPLGDVLGLLDVLPEVLLSELPDIPPEPLVWAATTTGAKPMTRASNIISSFFMGSSFTGSKNRTD